MAGADRTARAPFGLDARSAGWTLAGGGIGYLLSPFITYLVDAGAIAAILVVPATVGECWMIGYLLVRGVRTAVTAAGPEERDVAVR